MHRQLCASLESIPLCEVLKKVDSSDCGDFYKFYLYDFVRLVHKSVHKESEELTEYQVSVFDSFILHVRIDFLYVNDNHFSPRRVIVTLGPQATVNQSRLL